MSYTVWSRGILVGHCDLGYVRAFPRHRMGDFFPTEEGEKMMPVATGVSLAGIEAARVLSAISEADFDMRDIDSANPIWRQTSQYADFVAAEYHRDALELELRGPEGAPIATEWIDIRDTEQLLSLARDDDLDDFVLNDDLDAEALADVAGAVDEQSEGSAAVGPGAGASMDALPDLTADFALDFEDAEEWLSDEPFPRYQLQVMLHDDASVP